MEYIFVPPQSNTNTTHQGDMESSPPHSDQLPQISVTLDEVTSPIIPHDTPPQSISTDHFEGFPLPSSSEFLPASSEFLQSSSEFLQSSSEFKAAPYSSDPFPPCWVFESRPMPLPSGAVEDKDLAQDSIPSAKVLDTHDDLITASDDEEEEEEEEEEEDWSLASSEPWHLVSDNQHSTPSDFVMASAGTPSIPDDLMSFSSDQEEEEGSSDEDQDKYHVSFYDYNLENKDGRVDSGLAGQGNKEDLQNSSSAVRNKNLSFGYLSREDTLDEEPGGCNDIEDYVLPLGDPLLSSIVFNVEDVEAGTDDVYHDTEEGDEDMETPRAVSIRHITNLNSLHSLCSASPSDHDMASWTRNASLYSPSVPQKDRVGITESPMSLQEESFFDSGDFQRVDEAYEYYPAKIQARKVNDSSVPGQHHQAWFKLFKRHPKRGRAKRKSKDKRSWKLYDQIHDFYPF